MGQAQTGKKYDTGVEAQKMSGRDGVSEEEWTKVSGARIETKGFSSQKAQVECTLRYPTESDILGTRTFPTPSRNAKG